MSAQFFVFWGVIMAGLAVGLGAFGAHALKATLDSYGKDIWEKAVFYQTFHALALVALAGLSQWLSPRIITWSGSLFITGILLFSGSLYILALTGKKWMGAITPLGGVAFLVAWTLLAVALAKGQWAS